MNMPLSKKHPPRHSYFKVLGKVWGAQKTNAELLNNLAEQAQWLQAVRSGLPENLATHCKNARLQDDVLLLHASSSAWATRLRYLSPMLLAYLGKLFDHAPSSIKVRVAHHMPTIKKAQPQKNRPRMSPQAAKSLCSAAAGVAHPRLKEALRRLANHADQKRRG